MPDYLNIPLPGRLLAVEARCPPPQPSPRGRRAGGSPGAAKAAGTRRQMPPDLQAERAALSQAVQALQAAAGRLDRLQADLLAEAEGQLVTLAVEIARKVLMQEIQAGRCQIEPIVQEALRRIPARHEVTVHLNPDDLARCRMAQGLGPQNDGGSVRFLADPKVSRGECLLATPEGIVESTVEGHLQDVVEALNAPEGD